MPPLMSNKGNYVVSLGNVVRWLGEQAEALGVEIYPGFPAAEVLKDSEGNVIGVATGDLGVGRDGKPKDEFVRGMALLGKYTLIAEGPRGSLAKKLIRDFGLDTNCMPQKYGIGLKELWQVKPDKHKPGLVQHTMGWPLEDRTGGGSFMYHYGENLVSVGFVVHLNYENPYTSPFHEFQRLKTHPLIAAVLEGGKRIGYGARAIAEGGWQSIPKLTFPGGALIGCSAGFVNVPRIKGSHNAILSGVAAAESAFEALQAGRSGDELLAYEERVRRGPIARDLKPVRNAKPLLSRFGTFKGTLISGLDMWLNTISTSLSPTLKHQQAGLRGAEAGERVQADPVSEAGREAHLRYPVLAVPVRHEPRGRSARPPRSDRPGGADPRQPSGFRGTRAALLPSGRLRGGDERGGQTALSDQRAELRSLQDLRHQRPRPEHQLAASGGRRRPELFWNVK